MISFAHIVMLAWYFQASGHTKAVSVTPTVASREASLSNRPSHATNRMTVDEWRRDPSLPSRPNLSGQFAGSLRFSTFVGGSDRDSVDAIARCPNGGIVAVGATSSVDFSTAFGSPGSPSGAGDVFVIRINDVGQPLWFRYLGGSDPLQSEGVYAVDCDLQDNVVVGGYTTSTDFPTKNAFQPSPGDGNDGFITKFDSSGGLVFSSFVGGKSADSVRGVGTDPSGNVYLVGSTNDAIAIPQVNPFQIPGVMPDGFVMKLSPAGGVLYSSYLGGSRIEPGDPKLSVDATGRVIVVGTTSSSDFPVVAPIQGILTGPSDMFISVVAPDGGRLEFSTYYGGTGAEAATAVAIDSSGTAVVAGATTSPDYPLLGSSRGMLSGTSDGAIVVLRYNATPLVLFSDYLGGSGSEGIVGASFDGQGNIIVGGWTESIDYPVSQPLQSRFGGIRDLVLSSFDANGYQLLGSFYLGGADRDTGGRIALDVCGNAFLSGSTASLDWPMKAAIQGSYGGGAFDGCLAMVEDPTGTARPQAIGNSLRVSSDIGSSDSTFEWTDVPSASEYRLWSSLVKGAFPTLEAVANSGSPGITLTTLPGPLVFLAVAGANCAGEGPL